MWELLLALPGSTSNYGLDSIFVRIIWEREEHKRILMGNEAMGRGLVEAGVTLAASYPGTPASEILPGGGGLCQRDRPPIHTEWSVNEKVAYETALANAIRAGARRWP